MASNENNEDQSSLLKIRRDKLSALQEAGNDPFKITKYDQTHHADEVKKLYEERERELLKDYKSYLK